MFQGFAIRRKATVDRHFTVRVSNLGIGREARQMTIKATIAAAVMVAWAGAAAASDTQWHTERNGSPADKTAAGRHRPPLRRPREHGPPVGDIRRQHPPLRRARKPDRGEPTSIHEAVTQGREEAHWALRPVVARRTLAKRRLDDRKAYLRNIMRNFLDLTLEDGAYICAWNGTARTSSSAW